MCRGTLDSTQYYWCFGGFGFVVWVVCGWVVDGFFVVFLFLFGWCVFGVWLVGVLFVFGRGCPWDPSKH